MRPLDEAGRRDAPLHNWVAWLVDAARNAATPAANVKEVS